MTIEEALKSTTLPRSESELLMSSILRCTRTEVFVRLQENLKDSDAKLFAVLVKRRESHEPIAYITGSKEFYGKNYLVTRDVLIPRPSTEYIIDGVREFLSQRTSQTKDADTDIVILIRSLRDGPIEEILEVGTGSGNIIVTLAVEIPGFTLRSVDTSSRALEIAKANAKRIAPESKIVFVENEGVREIEKCSRPFLLVSNPPYIPASLTLGPDVKNFEPHQALFAGEDGLDLLRALVIACIKNPRCKGLIVECRSDQEKEIDSLLVGAKKKFA